MHADEMKSVICLLMFAVLGVMVSDAAENQDQAECPMKADIIFVLDASSSIWGPDFKKQLDFVKTIIQDFDIGPSMVRCGLVTYSHVLVEEFGLLSYSSADEVIKAVSRVEQLRGNTRTDLALRHMMGMMADDKRPGVPQIGIVITDGDSDNMTATRLEAEAAHMAGITMFAVGIGRKVEDNELNSIASQEDFRFNVESFDGLETIRKMLTTKACHVTPPNDRTTDRTEPKTGATTSVSLNTESSGILTGSPLTQSSTNIETATTSTTSRSTPSSGSEIWGNLTATTPVEMRESTPTSWLTGCGKPADVIFVLDESVHVKALDFKKLLELMGRVIRTFSTEPSMVRFGLVTFGHDVHVEFGLLNHSSAKAALESVSFLKQLQGNSRMDLALQKVREILRDDKRSGVPQIAIVVTDADSDFAGLKTEAEAARGEGIILFAVGLGKDVDLKQLEEIASKNEFAFDDPIHEDFVPLEKSLYALICNSSEVIQPLPECKNVTLDISFLLDHSIRLYPDNLQHSQRFVIDCLLLLPSVSTNQTRVSAVTFGDISQSRFDLDTYSNLTDIDWGLSHIGQSNSITDMAGALTIVGSSTKSKYRKNSKKAVVIVTGGRVGDIERAELEANALKAIGVDIYVVAVGTGCDRKELEWIASGNKTIFNISRYDQLEFIPADLVKAICDSIPVPLSTTVGFANLTTASTANTTGITLTKIFASASTTIPTLSTTTIQSTSGKTTSVEKQSSASTQEAIDKKGTPTTKTQTPKTGQTTTGTQSTNRVSPTTVSTQRPVTSQTTTATQSTKTGSPTTVSTQRPSTSQTTTATQRTKTGSTTTVSTQGPKTNQTTIAAQSTKTGSPITVSIQRPSTRQTTTGTQSTKRVSPTTVSTQGPKTNQTTTGTQSTNRVSPTTVSTQGPKTNQTTTGTQSTKAGSPTTVSTQRPNTNQTTTGTQSTNTFETSLGSISPKTGATTSVSLNTESSGIPTGSPLTQSSTNIEAATTSTTSRSTPSSISGSEIWGNLTATTPVEMRESTPIIWQKCRPADIVFALPSALGQDDTDQAMKCIEAFGDLLGIDGKILRLGFTPPLCPPHVPGINLNQNSVVEEIRKALEYRVLSANHSDIIAQLRHLNDVSFNPEQLVGRANSLKVAVVFFDPTIEVSAKVIEEVNHLKRRNITVVVVSVGDDTGRNLENLVSCSECLIHVNDYSALNGGVSDKLTDIVEKYRCLHEA